MSCISQAWCPQCAQIVSDSICMCALVCDRHGRVCTRVIPDGSHDVRETGKSTPRTKNEYRNGWCVGFNSYTRDEAGQYIPHWVTCEPGHPTKTPFEVEQEWRDKQAIQDAERWRIRQIEERDQLNCNGGGSI